MIWIWVKVIHLLCVMGWMTSVFAVPRALIYWRREHERLGENGPLGDLTFRLYRFSGGLALIALVSGVWMAWQLGFPNWIWLKLAFVIAIGAHFDQTGRLVRAAQRGEFPKSDLWLRLFNEASVIGVIVVLYLVVAKPF